MTSWEIDELMELVEAAEQTAWAELHAIELEEVERIAYA